MKAFDYFMRLESEFRREEEQASVVPAVERFPGLAKTEPQRQELMRSAHANRAYYLGKALDVLEGRIPDIEMGS